MKLSRTENGRQIPFFVLFLWDRAKNDRFFSCWKALFLLEYENRKIVSRKKRTALFPKQFRKEEKNETSKTIGKKR